MANVVILERKDDDDGMSSLWVSVDMERLRLKMSTATLNGPIGHQTVETLSMMAIDRNGEAAARGKLRKDNEGVDGSV